MLSKEDILKADDLKTAVVDVPEWGGQVMIRELTAGQRDRFEQDNLQRNGKNYQVNLIDMHARLVAMSVVGKDGKRLFSDADVRALSGKSSKAMDRIFQACQRLNGIGRDDIDEMAKNSETAQAVDSPSD